MSCQDKEIPVNQASEPCVKSTDIFRRNLRALPVDRSFLIRENLHIDTGHALLDRDKVALHPVTVKKAADFRPRKAGRKTERRILKTQPLEGQGNIDSLSARIDRLRSRAVDAACSEMFHSDDVIQGRAECNRINQICLPIILLPYLFTQS